MAATSVESSSSFGDSGGLAGSVTAATVMGFFAAMRRSAFNPSSNRSSESESLRSDLTKCGNCRRKVFIEE